MSLASSLEVDLTSHDVRVQKKGKREEATITRWILEKALEAPRETQTLLVNLSLFWLNLVDTFNRTTRAVSWAELRGGVEEWKHVKGNLILIYFSFHSLSLCYLRKEISWESHLCRRASFYRSGLIRQREKKREEKDNSKSTSVALRDDHGVLFSLVALRWSEIYWFNFTCLQAMLAFLHEMWWKSSQILVFRHGHAVNINKMRKTCQHDLNLLDPNSHESGENC